MKKTIITAGIIAGSILLGGYLGFSAGVSPAVAQENLCHTPEESLVAIYEEFGSDFRFDILGPSEAKRVLTEFEERSRRPSPFTNDTLTYALVIKDDSQSDRVFIQWFANEGFACDNVASAAGPSQFKQWIENNTSLVWKAL